MSERIELCECGHPRADHPGPLPASCQHGMVKDYPVCSGPGDPGYGCACRGWKPAPKWDPELAAVSDRMQRTWAPRNYGPLPDDSTPDLVEELGGAYSGDPDDL